MKENGHFWKVQEGTAGIRDQRWSGESAGTEPAALNSYDWVTIPLQVTTSHPQAGVIKLIVLTTGLWGELNKDVSLHPCPAMCYG